VAKRVGPADGGEPAVAQGADRPAEAAGVGQGAVDKDDRWGRNSHRRHRSFVDGLPVGNLVDDPELRFTNNGIAVANLRVAVTQRIQQDGEWRDGDTSFLKVNVWRGQAEHLADSLSKGDRVMVTGRLRQRSWETPEGDKRAVTEIEADEVGASLKWATAKVERASQRGNGERNQGRERAVERGGDFNDPAPF
jgi:single-strand DNA-binding protein